MNMLLSMLQNPVDTMKKYNAFKENFLKKNMDPQAAVQNLLNSGQMTQQQFEQFRAAVNQLTGQKM